MPLPLALGAAVLVALLIVTWQAGRGSGELGEQKFSSQVGLLNQQLASTRVDLDLQRTKTVELERALNQPGAGNALAIEIQNRQQLLKAQAEAN